MKGYFHRVQEQTATRFWINNVTREQATLAIEAGAVGCTQNPAYTWKMIQRDEERPYVEEKLGAILAVEPDDGEALVKLQRELVAGVAARFLPVFEASGGRQGYVSIQGDPLHEDVDTIVRHARFNTSIAPNIMAKVPVTVEGLEAIRILLSEGIPINATEVMAVRQAVDVCRVYNEVCGGMAHPPKMYFSHITGILDEHLQKTAAVQNISVNPDALWAAGMSIAKKTYWMAKETAPEVGFISGGARGLHHFTEMVGADAAVTINWTGTADTLLEQDGPVIQRFQAPTPYSVVEELCEKLPDYRKGYFQYEIQPSEYEGFGPVVLFRSGFESAWKNALAFAARRRGTR